MAILINQSNNNNSTSGETLLASSSLENSINEAKELSINLDSKIADLKDKLDEVKTEYDLTLTAVFDKIDKKEKSFTKSVDGSATKAINNIANAVNDLKQASSLIKNIWIIPQAIMIHVILFIVELAFVFWICLPVINQARKTLSNNEQIIKISLERKQENEKLLRENQGLNDELVNLNEFINFVYGDKEEARQAYRKWRSNN